MLADILLVVNIVAAVLLVLLILVQRSEGGLGSLGGEGGNALMGGANSGNSITRVTAILATVFLGSSLWLAVETGGTSRTVSVVDSVTSESMDTSPEVPMTLPAKEGSEESAN